MCQPAALRRPCFLGVLHPLWLLLFLPLFSQGFLNPEGKDLMETSCLGLSVSRFSFSLYFLAVDLYVCSHLLQEEASLMMSDQDNDL